MQDSQDMFADTQDPKRKQGKTKVKFQMILFRTDPLHPFVFLKF